MEIHRAYKKICSMPFMKKGSHNKALFIFDQDRTLLAFETKERIITIAGHSLSLDPT